MVRSAFIIGFMLCFISTATSRDRDINVQNMGVAQGLSHYTVNSFYEDEFGFMWLGTMDGLNCFDGKQVEVFKPVQGDTTSISENNIRYICGDKSGHIYIKGLSSLSELNLKTRKFRVIKREGVNAISFAEGRLWVAMDDTILRYEDGNLIKQFALRDMGIDSVMITSFTLLSDQTIALCSKENGVFVIDKQGEIIQHLPIGEANSIYTDWEENVWVSTRSEGLYKVTAEGVSKHFTSSTAPESLRHNNVRSVQQVANNSYYVGTYGGLSLLDDNSDTFTHYQYEQQREAVNIRSIISMFQDSKGTLWIGTFYEGAHYYHPEYNIFTYYHPTISSESRIAHPIVSSFVEDGGGNVWIGIDGGGVIRVDRGSNELKYLNQGTPGGQSISSNNVKSLYYDKEHNCIWLSMLYGGVDRIDLATHSVRRATINQKSMHDAGLYNLVKIAPYNSDTLLLGSSTGLFILDKTEMKISRLKGYSVTNQQVWDIIKDGDNLIWYSTSTHLHRYDICSNETKKYSFDEISNSNTNNYITTITTAPDGALWFGSSGSGIFIYDRETDSFRQYALEQGLDNGYITNIVYLADGDLILGTNGGVSRFWQQTKTFDNYNIQNRFPFSVVNRGGMLITTDGRLFVGGQEGIVSMRESDLKSTIHDYNIYITSLVVNNKRVEPGDATNILSENIIYQKQIRLRPKHTTFSLAIADNDLINPTRSKLEYMLQGFDADFMMLDNNYMPHYTNIDPGDYTFIVKGTSPNLRGEIPQTTLEIVILAPFYKTGWFYSLCALLLASLLLYLLKSYITRVKLEASLDKEKREKQHIEELNQSKLRFFTNISHEFRTPLTLIISQLELVLQNKETKPKLYNNLLNILRNSNRMRRLVDEIIDIRREEQGFLKLRVSRGDLVYFLREILLSFEEYARNKKIELKFTTSIDKLNLLFDPNQMEKVIYNLLSNAFKYTQEGDQIELQIEDRGDDVSIVVRDTGIGIAQEHLPFIFNRFYQDESANSKVGVTGSGVGLSLSKAIVEFHNGTITASSEGSGSVFQIILPKVESYNSENVVAESDTKSIKNYLVENDREHELLEEIEDIRDISAKILIVEDNEELRLLLSHIFSPLYDVTLAADGEQGIELATELQPDIILSDIMMPGMSGLEMCSQLKNNISTSHIPIVLLTARNTEEHMVEGLLTGADDYITKPFSAKLLVARCNNLVRGRQHLQQIYRQDPDSKIQTLATNTQDQELLSRAVLIVSENLDNPDFNINKFSLEMGLSRTYLFSKLKGLTGQTPNDFIMGQRLKRSIKLMFEDTQASMSEIAYSLGFSSSSYFTKCFRSTYGETPTTYRKRILEQ